MPPKEQTPPPPSTITGNSRITVTLLGGILLCAFYAGVKVTQIDNGITSLKEQIGAAWTLDNMKVYAAQMKASNPNLNVPDPAAVKGGK